MRGTVTLMATKETCHSFPDVLHSRTKRKTKQTLYDEPKRLGAGEEQEIQSLISSNKKFRKLKPHPTFPFYVFPLPPQTIKQ